MFDRLTGEYLGSGKPDYAEERRRANEWYHALPEAQKAVMRVFGRVHAQERMRRLADFLRAQGVNPLPKAETQYELAFGMIDELTDWLKEA